MCNIWNFWSSSFLMYGSEVVEMKNSRSICLSLSIICIFFSAVIATLILSSLSSVFAHLSINYKNNNENVFPQFTLIFLNYFNICLLNFNNNIDIGANLLGAILAGLILTLIDYFIIKKIKKKLSGIYQ